MATKQKTRRCDSITPEAFGVAPDSLASTVIQMAIDRYRELEALKSDNPELKEEFATLCGLL